MPRIHDVLLNAVTFVDVEKIDGSHIGGTGFAVDYPSRTGLNLAFRYVITNGHIVAGASGTKVRVNTTDGKRYTEDIPPADWCLHPDGDDVAAAIFAMRPDSRVQGLAWDDFAPTLERIGELNMGVGDDVIMIGRFSGVPGEHQDQPVARFGNIAMMPGEKIEDGRGLKVEAYLCEMRSQPGYSGSPVFVYMGPGTYRGSVKKMMPFFSETYGLIGIDSGHTQLVSPVYEGGVRRDDLTTRLDTAMSIVVPASKIEELLHEDAFVRQRESAESQARSKP